MRLSTVLHPFFSPTAALSSVTACTMQGLSCASLSFLFFLSALQLSAQWASLLVSHVSHVAHVCLSSLAPHTSLGTSISASVVRLYECSACVSVSAGGRR